MVCNHCALCGIALDGKKRRLFCPVEGVRFVVERCKTTPFVYAVLSRGLLSRCDERMYMCIPCVNWKRRLTQGTIRRYGKPMLQLDRMIMFLLQPGRIAEPDMRCMERLVKAVRQDSNPYFHVFPAPVQWIARAIHGDTYLHCVVAWWDYNGRPPFFSSAQEARRVRSAIKMGLCS